MNFFPQGLLLPGPLTGTFVMNFFPQVSVDTVLASMAPTTSESSQTPCRAYCCQAQLKGTFLMNSNPPLPLKLSISVPFMLSQHVSLDHIPSNCEREPVAITW